MHRLPCKVDRLEGFVMLWKKDSNIITVGEQIIDKVRTQTEIQLQIQTHTQIQIQTEIQIQIQTQIDSVPED